MYPIALRAYPPPGPGLGRLQVRALGTNFGSKLEVLEVILGALGAMLGSKLGVLGPILAPNWGL